MGFSCLDCLFGLSVGMWTQPGAVPVRDLFEGVYLNYDHDIIFRRVFPDGSDFSRGFSITAAN